jgi:riboflavin synthase alpha subunit
MFTGIVESLGEIVSVVAIGRDGGLRMTVDAPLRELVIGESIAVDGACLTVVARRTARRRSPSISPPKRWRRRSRALTGSDRK